MSEGLGSGHKIYNALLSRHYGGVVNARDSNKLNLFLSEGAGSNPAGVVELVGTYFYPCWKGKAFASQDSSVSLSWHARARAAADVYMCILYIKTPCSCYSLKEALVRRLGALESVVQV